MGFVSEEEPLTEVGYEEGMELRGSEKAACLSAKLL